MYHAITSIIVSASKSIEDKYSTYSVPNEEFVKPGLRHTSYVIVTLIQRLVS